MLSPESSLQTIIHECFSPSEKLKLLVGVSGGIDSVVLVHLLKNAGIEFGIAHCNFGLRGIESDEDELFVANLGLALTIPVYVKKFDTSSVAAQMGISIQMAARKLRMEWMNEICTSQGYQLVCLAHHHDDNMETFFLNLFRGTGTRGLKGMDPLSGNILRPLIHTNRIKIEQYASKNKLMHREDSSNAEDKYKRNKIRHHIIPSIEKEFPDFSEKMITNFQKISAETGLYRHFINLATQKHLQSKNGVAFVKLKDISKYPQPGVFLREILSEYGLSLQQTNAMIQCASSSETSEFMTSTHHIYVKSGIAEITVFKEFDETQWLISAPEKFSENLFPLNLEVQIVNRADLLSLKLSPDHALIDAEKIHFPLILRRWKKGDVFMPFGMKQQKLLSDFFHDLKLTKIQKQQVWLICSGHDIVWIVGYRIHDQYKILPNTKQVMHLQLIH